MTLNNIGPRIQKMTRQATARPNLTELLKLLGVAAVYALGSWLLETSLVPDGGEATFFLPSGLALAAVLMGGKRYTWAVALGAFSGNMLFGSPFVASALMALAAAAAALLGAWLVQRPGKFNPALTTLPDVLRLWFFGGFVASTLSAVFGTAALMLAGLVSHEAFATNMTRWWMGDTTGVVLIAPLILAWWPVLSRRWSRPSLKLLSEYALILSVAVLIGGTVYLGWTQPRMFTESQYLSGFLERSSWTFVITGWAALRLGLRGASLTLLVLAFQSQFGLYENVGLFGSNPNDLAQTVNGWSHTIVLSAIGTVLGILVTSNKRVTESLRLGKEILANDLHNIMAAVNHHSMVTVSDALARITWANDKWCETHGYPAAEILGKDHWLFKSGIHLDEFFQDMYKTINAGHIWQGELCNRAKDGRLIWLQKTIVPVIGNNGKPEKYIDISTNISENKRLEAFAQTGNTAKSEFLANMSHEIRTPMNGVIGMVDVLQQSKLMPAQKQMLDTIQKSSMALLAIVNDILDFSKIESGMLRVEVIAFDLRELVESAAQIVVATAVSKSINFCLFMSPELPTWALSDPSRLRQVLLNLLSNAVKFTPCTDSQAAKVVFFVEPCTLKQGGPGFKLCVRDSGIGMSAETLDKLFQPFTQADASTSRKFGGSGLGLSICKQLVELMGGQISVTSTLGEGSEFTVEMPLLPAPTRPMPLFNERLDGVHVVAVIEDSVRAAIVSSYCHHAGATVTVIPHLAAVRHHLEKQPVNAANTVVLLGHEFDSRPLDLPEAAQVVRMVKQSDIKNINAATLRVCPMLYRELIRSVALASRQPASSVVPKFEQQPALAPRTSILGSTVAANNQLILLAEDNEINRDVIQTQLQLLGYASEAAVDGSGALAMWRTDRFALLLTDCHMPNMDGFELTAEIRRAEPVGSRFPIVAITANAMQGEAQRCRQRGMDDYISKPMRMEDLAPLLEKWLPLSSLQAQELLSETQQATLPDVLATWDTSTLTTMVGNNLALHFKLLTKFLINAEQQVNMIVIAIEAGEQSNAADIAHALKSSSRMVGALMLGELCESMETAADSQDLTACRTLVPCIKKTFPLVQESIAQHISQLKLHDSKQQ